MASLIYDFTSEMKEKHRAINHTERHSPAYNLAFTSNTQAITHNPYAEALTPSLQIKHLDSQVNKPHADKPYTRKGNLSLRFHMQQ